MLSKYFDERTQCPACRNTGFNEIYNRSYYDDNILKYLHRFYNEQGGIEQEFLKDANYVITECKKCGLVFQKEIPNEFLMKKLYEEWLDPVKIFEIYEKNHTLDYYENLTNELKKIILHFNKNPSDIKLFDFAMGWANWCKTAISLGCKVYGSELSEARILNASKIGVKVLNWDEITSQKFDFINTEQVLEHLSYPLDTVIYLKKALKDQGVLKISVPNGFDIHRRLKIMDWGAPKSHENSLNPVAPLEHINCFNRNSIITLAHCAGLKEVKLKNQIENNSTSLIHQLKNLLRPAYRFIKPNQYPFENTYMFFEHK